MSNIAEHYKVGRCEVEIHYDEDAPNPLEDYDSEGKIYSFSTRHRYHINPDEVTGLENSKYAVPLSYFEHGQCLWDVQHGGRISNCPDMRRDGVSYAGVWVPDQGCLDNMSIKPKTPLTKKVWKKLEEYAAGVCKSYTSYCNGECYGYVVTGGDKEDSCWGYLGDIEYCREEAKSVAKSMDEDLAIEEKETAMAEVFP